MSAAADDRLHGAFPNSPSANADLRPSCNRTRGGGRHLHQCPPVFPAVVSVGFDVPSHSVRPSSPTRAAARSGTWHACCPVAKTRGNRESRLPWMVVVTAERGLGRGGYPKCCSRIAIDSVSSFIFGTRAMESLPRLTIDETALPAGGVGWVYRCDDTISAPRSGVPGTGTTLEGVVDAMMDGGWEL